MYFENILKAVGHTPLVKLNRIVPEGSANVYVKYEGVNIGGSIKTRTALNMIEAAEKQGLLHKGSIIVEPSSGNQGIGLALVGAVKGYKVKIVLPDSVSGERKKLIENYGAEVVLVHDAGDIGKCIAECLNTALDLAKKDSNVFVPHQFENINNTNAHKLYTAQEILNDFDQEIHGFCSGIGTGGTITGVGGVLKEKYPNMLVWAIEPENAAILSGKPIGTHIQMGIGDGLIPEILDTKIYDDICIVPDADAVQTAKRLAREEGLMCGISSGSNVYTALKMAKLLGKGKNVITILPDTAERYFSTELFE